MKSFFKGYAYAVVVGLIMILAGAFIENNAAPTGELTSKFCKFLNPASSTLVISGGILLAFPIIILPIIFPLIPTMLKASSNDFLEKISKNISSVAASFHEILEHAKKHEQGAECTKLRAVQAFEDYCVPLLFGDHSLDSDSLVNYVKKYILDKYCNYPYKSEFKRNVTIINANDSDYFTWSENTNFRIQKHFEDNCAFNLAYNAGTECEESQIPHWLENFSLSVEVGGETILVQTDKPKKLEVAPDNELKEGYYYWYDRKGKFIYINFLKKIILTTNSTMVNISEDSINSRNDLESLITIPEPIFNYEVTFEVPTGYKVFNPRYLGTAYYENPREIDSHIKRATSRINAKKIKVKNDGWIMPGLFLHLRWGES